MALFFGICIGGPLAGRLVEENCSKMIVPVLSDRDATYAAPADPFMSPEITTFQYVFTRVDVDDDRPSLGYWVPSSVDTDEFNLCFEYIMRELTSFYHQQHVEAGK